MSPSRDTVGLPLPGGAALERVGLADLPPEEWNRLARAGGSIFATWDWVSTWWRHFGGERELALWVVRTAAGRRPAILPLYVWRSRPLRVLRFLGHLMGNRLGPICAPGTRPLAAAALERVLAASRFDVLVADGLDGAARWPALLGRRAWRRIPSPRLSLQPYRSWDEFLAGRSANFRQELRRKERLLARQGVARYRLATDPARIDADLDTLFALHRQRWGTETPFSAAEAFHRAFALQAFLRGWLRLWLLEVDGRRAAALYGLRFAGTEYYYQAGRDPSWARFSPGLLLLARSLRSAIEDGISEYDLGPGGGAYKYRLADADPGREDLIWTAGVLGRTAVGLLWVARSVPLLRGIARRRLQG